MPKNTSFRCITIDYHVQIDSFSYRSVEYVSVIEKQCLLNIDRIVFHGGQANGIREEI